MTTQTKNNFSKNNFYQSSTVLLTSLIFGLFAIAPVAVIAEASRSMFQESNISIAIKKITSNAAIIQSADVKLQAPKIAESSATVSVKVLTKLKNVEQITLFAEKNPKPLLASYKISPAADLSVVKSVIKLREPSNIIALVKADGTFYMAKQFVKVTPGGCGGTPVNGE